MNQIHIYTKRLVAVIAVMVLSFVSCKKFVQIPPAPNLILDSQVFSDSTDADAAVLGLYINMTKSSAIAPLSGMITVYTGISSDELYSTSAVAAEKAVYTNSLLPTNAYSGNLWTGFYGYIYKTNAIIEGLAANTFSQSARNQLTGEAKVVRALVYFNLVNLFGAVPVVTSTDYATNAVMPRNSVDSVYQLIINDLISARDLLPENYLTPGRVRPNHYTATALLAKAYLYKHDWVKAEQYASELINDSTIYKLNDDLNQVFLSTNLHPENTEAIWQVIPVQPGIETAEGLTLVPSNPTAKPRYPINDYLFNAFEPGDLRAVNWINSTVNGGTTYHYPFKYKLRNDGNSTPEENYMVLRLSEQYLIRAEARAQQGKLDESIADLNRIRTRAGLTEAAPASQDDLLAAVYHERQVELFCEWGNRWYDIKRTGLVNSVMGSPGGVCASKGGVWTSDAQLYPIPQDQISRNPYLTQNPGYN